MYYVFAFIGRSEALKLYEECRGKVRVTLVSTPRSIFSGCSLSVKCSEGDYDAVLRVFYAHKFSTFLGAYYVYIDSGTLKVKKILQ